MIGSNNPTDGRPSPSLPCSICASPPFLWRRSFVLTGGKEGTRAESRPLILFSTPLLISLNFTLSSSSVASPSSPPPRRTCLGLDRVLTSSLSYGERGGGLARPLALALAPNRGKNLRLAAPFYIGPFQMFSSPIIKAEKPKRNSPRCLSNFESDLWAQCHFPPCKRGAQFSVLTEGATDCGSAQWRFFSPCGSQLVNLTERASGERANGDRGRSYVLAANGVLSSTRVQVNYRTKVCVPCGRVDCR